MAQRLSIYIEPALEIFAVFVARLPTWTIIRGQKAAVLYHNVTYGPNGIRPTTLKTQYVVQLSHCGILFAEPPLETKAVNLEPTQAQYDRCCLQPLLETSE